MEPFLSEIRLVSFGFAPAGWKLCNGDLMLIKDYPGLYSLIGIAFGGDGVVNFALPDLRGRAPMVVDPTGIKLGAKVGTPTNLLTLKNLPEHSHDLKASKQIGTLSTGNPIGNIFGDTGLNDNDYATYPQKPNPTLGTMSSKIIAEAGGTTPMPNMMPYLGLNFMIAIEGIYPPKP